MDSILDRYHYNLRRHKKVYIWTFIVTVFVVGIGLFAYSTINANYNRSIQEELQIEDTEDYCYFSKMFFAGYAVYSEGTSEDGNPVVKGYRYQTIAQSKPLLKMMNVCVSGENIRNELLTKAGLTWYSADDFEIQISEYGSMCYRYYVYSRDLGLAITMGYRLEENIAEIFERDLGITYVRVTGKNTVKRDQPAPEHYLYRVNDSYVQLGISEETGLPINNTSERRVFGKKLCAAAGLGAGILVVLILLILWEYFSNGMYKPEQLQKVKDYPFLASIPRKKSENVLKILAKTVISGNGFGKVILAAGCAPKNIVFGGVAGFARALSDEGKNVLLLNLSSEKRGMDKLLKLDKRYGSSDMQHSKLNIMNISDNLDAVSAGSRPEDMDKVCESDEFRDVLIELRDNYDYILCYDTNILESPQMQSVVKMVDSVILAVEYNGINSSQLKLTVERLELLGAKSQFFMMTQF